MGAREVKGGAAGAGAERPQVCPEQCVVGLGGLWVEAEN